jgi:hypothetical protein
MRISLGASPEKAAPGSKVDTANIAATARREILDMSPPSDALKTAWFFNKLHRNATRKYVPPRRHGEHSFAQTDWNPA